jgi:hypothetical protein
MSLSSQIIQATPKRAKKPEENQSIPNKPRKPYFDPLKPG